MEIHRVLIFPADVGVRDFYHMGTTRDSVVVMPDMRKRLSGHNSPLLSWIGVEI